MDNAYFADAIQDEILTRLSKIADLKVISRTSTQHYKTVPANVPDIAKQLGVAHILEGSVQKSGDAVRVNVQLIKAASDSHVWADTFDRKLTDILSVESEVAKAIADQLRVKLTGREKEVVAAKPTGNPEAYDNYLRGLAYTLRTGNNPANALGAQKYLKEAVRLDPKFALAWALLSYTDAVGYRTLTLQPTVALREEARQAAETALTLQPNLGEAVLAMGYYHYSCLNDYDTAERYFEEARPLLPNSSRIPESWPISSGGEAGGTRARPISTKRSGSTRATLIFSPSMRFSTCSFVVARKRCESWIRCSISHRTTWIRSRYRPVSRKARAICHGQLRFWLRFTLVRTMPLCWKRKFIKRSWNVNLHPSFPG